MSASHFLQAPADATFPAMIDELKHCDIRFWLQNAYKHVLLYMEKNPFSTPFLRNDRTRVIH